MRRILITLMASTLLLAGCGTAAPTREAAAPPVPAEPAPTLKLQPDNADLKAALAHIQ